MKTPLYIVLLFSQFLILFTVIMKKVDYKSNVTDLPSVLGRFHRTVVKHGDFGESMTDQQYKAESDINEILRRYNCGLGLPPSRGTGRYVDVSECGDYASLLNQVLQANKQFDSLPSDIRSRFGNSPAMFYQFVSNPANLDELCKLGLAVRREEPKEFIQKVEIVNPVTDSAGK